ncbi:MAG: type II toxin-antitoxin system HicB family antitoxin [Candidatus Gastranaerophilaceae bacterium]|jgi:predicted HicB family RNase H-like nuclease
MSKLMEYKGYYGTAEYSPDDEVFYGKIAFIRSLILYEAETAKELKQSFQEAVDDYIQTCEEAGIPLEKPCKGSFNVRVGEELHCKAAIYAEQHNTSINSIVKEALEKYIA